MTRKTLWINLVVVLFLFGSLAVFAQREPMPDNPSTEEKPVVEDGEQEVDRKRIREGTIFRGKKVVFQKIGTRTTIRTLDDTERYICLENLNLERILDAIEKRPARNVWAIDGMYTEFRGENYVLIRRGVVSSGGSPRREPAPETEATPAPVKSTGTPNNT